MWTIVRALWFPQADLPCVSRDRWVLLGEKAPRKTQSYLGSMTSQVEDAGGLFQVAPQPGFALQSQGPEVALETGPPPPTWCLGSQQRKCTPPQQRAPHSRVTAEAQGSR